MTLISRNKFLSGFCIFSIILLLIFFVLFLIKFNTGEIKDFPYPFITENLSLKDLLFSPYSIFPFFSIVFLGIFTLITASLIRYTFEKTQSPEIIYFIGFLFGCLLEISRLLIPMLNLWDSYSIYTILIGKVALTGRLISIFSLLLASIFHSDTQNQDTEKHLFFTIFFSALFAVFIPIKTGVILPSIMTEIGFHTFFLFINGLIFILSCISMIFTDRKKLVIFYCMLILGYIFLVYTNNLFLLILGVGFISYGAYAYLGKIHNYYLWR